MSATHQKVQRLLELFELLRSRPHTPKELADKLGVSERTAFRYLADLQAWQPDLQKDDLRHTYFLPHKERLTEMEALVTHSALRLMCHHTPGYNQLYINALEKLARGLPQPVRDIAQRSTKALQALQGTNYNEGRTLEMVAQAWFQRRVLKFKYVAAAGSGRKHPNEVEVYFVEISRANLGAYIIGLERGYHRDVRIFKLNRMSDIALDPAVGAYQIPTDFDPLQYLQGAWGVVGSSGGGMVEVHLRFAKEAAYRVLEGGYPNMRLSSPDEQGRLEAWIQVGTTNDGFPLEILSWVQSWGPRVEVLSPANLRERWLEEAGAVLGYRERFDANTGR